MNQGNSDQDFDSFRRRRERRRLTENGSAPSAPTGALQELLEVEAREERNRMLTRDVQDFFESATRVAANIVGRVADTAKSEADLRVDQEMAEFLRDALERLEQVVVDFVGRKQGPVAQQDVEPCMRNLVGKLLDGFRSSGTSGAEKHLGLDPTATDLDSIQREFRARIPERTEAAALHPVAGVVDLPGRDLTRTRPGPGNVEEHLAALTGATETRAPAAAKPAAPARAALPPELERFKEHLKSQVRSGAMTREQASAAWQARIRSNA